MARPAKPAKPGRHHGRKYQKSSKQCNENDEHDEYNGKLSKELPIAAVNGTSSNPPATRIPHAHATSHATPLPH